MSSRKRRTLGAVSAIAALAITGGVAAQFTTSTSSEPQRIGTGTVGLSLDNVAPTVWTDDIGNLAAGDSVERFVDLRNSGTLKLTDLQVAQTNTLGDLLTAPSDVLIKLQACSVAWTTATGACTGQSFEVLGATGVRDWAATKALKTFEEFGAGEVRHLKLTTTLAATATNAAQAKTGTITYTFSGAQRAAGAWGDVSDAQTALSKPAAITSTPSASGTSLTTSFEDQTNGAATYTISWGPVGDAAKVQSQTLPKGDTSYTIYGLTQGTAYDLTLTGQLGVQKTVTASTQTTTVVAPTALLTESVTKDSATLRWTDRTAGKATYSITATPSVGSAVVATTSTGATSHILTLSPGVTYAIALKASINGVSSAEATTNVTTESAGLDLTNAKWSNSVVATNPVNAASGAYGAGDLSGNYYRMGGNGAAAKIAKYSVSSNSWSVLPDMPIARERATAATSLDGSIYVMGGYYSGNYSSVSKFTPGTGQWSTVAPMSTVRIAATSVTGKDGSIYVFGGGSTNAVANYLSSAEKYNPATNTWSPIASMKEKRYYASSAVAADGSIYVFGGHNGSTALSTVERYDPTTNTWSYVAPMSSARANAVAAVDGSGTIYAIGGDGSSGYLNTVQKYNPATDKWSAGPSLNATRAYATSFVDEQGRIYVFGGLAAGSWSNATGSERLG